MKIEISGGSHIISQTLGIQLSLLYTPRRTPNSKEDFGDEKTYGLAVMRRGKNVITADLEKDFGLFLGNRTISLSTREEDKGEFWVVGIKEPLSSRKLSGLELYTTLEELKAEWHLD